MIYVTGDMHGDKKRWASSEIRKLKKGDTLLICGDFGFLWEDTKKEKAFLKKIGKKKFQTLFIDGTHENFGALEKYEVSEFAGGKVRTIYKNLKLLLRGNIYAIEGKSFFVFGGGESADKAYRRQQGTWWKEEMPTAAEIEQGKEALAEAGNKVDYVITHDAPTHIKDFMDMDNNERNALHVFFDYINENCKYKKWFFGKYHFDKTITPLHSCVFQKVVPLEPK